MRHVLQQIVPAFLGSATVAVAADGATTGGTSPLTIFFLVFFALIVAFQLVPGIMLFISVLRGVFSSSRKRAVASGEDDKPS